MAKKIQYEVGFIANTNELVSAVDRAVKSLQQLGTNPHLSITSELDKASTAALDLSNNLIKAFNTDTGKLDLVSFNNSLKASNMTIGDYADLLSKLGPAGERAFLNVALAVSKADLPLTRSNKLLDNLWTAMKNTMRWQLTSSAMHGFMSAVSTAYGYTQDLNESLNSILIVTGKTADEMSRYAEQANRAAKSLSTTTTNYTDASLIYYQQGLSDEEVQARTDTTIKLANVSRESAEEASEQLTAIWNNFDDGSKSLEYYVDVMAALGATTASSTQEISTGLQQFAAIADTVGLSYEYAASALATVTAETRLSANVVGTSFRTLFSRIQGLLQDGEAEDGTTLNKYSQALANVGIQIKDTEGNLKSMDQILSEMGETWKTLSEAQLLALAQTVGGARQYTLLIALMDSWDKFQKNLTTAYQSEGTLQEQADIYAESWEAAQKRVRAASEDIYDSLINDDFYIGLDKAFTPILTGIADVIDGLGGMQGVIAVVSVALNKLYGDRIALGLRDFATNISIVTGIAALESRTLLEQTVQAANGLTLTDMGNEAYARRLEMLNDDINLLGIINKYISTQDAGLKEQIANELRKLELMRQLVETHAADVDRLTAALNESRIDIGTSIHSPVEGWAELLKTLLGLIKGLDADSIIDSDNFDRTINRMMDKLTEFSRTRSSVFDFTREFDTLSRLGDVTVETFEKLWKAYRGGDAPEGVTTMSQMREEIDKLSTEADSARANADGLSLVLVLLGADPQALNSYVAIASRLQRALTELGFNADQTHEVLKKLGNDVAKDLLPKTNDWANLLIKAGTLLSLTSILMNGLGSLKSVITNDDLEPMEKFVLFMTSIGMILPTLSALAAQYKTALAGLTLGTVAATVATSALALAEAILAKNAAAAGGALTTMLGPLSLLISIGMILIPILTGIGEIIGDKIFPSAEKSAEAINKSAEAFKNAQGELESLNGELEEVATRIEEINSQDTISLTDKSELAKLERELDALLRKITLQERSLLLARELANEDFLDNYYNAYSDVIEGQEAQYATKDRIGLGLNTDEWISEHTEQLSQLELGYANWIATIEDGADFDPKTLLGVQEALEQARKNIFLNEDEYLAIYIEPILKDSFIKNIQDKLYDALLNGGPDSAAYLIGDEVEKSLRAAGISVDSFLQFINDLVDDTTLALTDKFGENSKELNDLFKSLTGEDWLFLSTVDLDQEGLNTVEDLINLLEEHKKNNLDVNVSLSGNYKEIHEIIDDLKFGDTISKEDYEALGSLAQGYFKEILGGEYQFIGLQNEFYETSRLALLDSLSESYNTYLDLQNSLKQFNTDLLQAQKNVAASGAIMNLPNVQAQIDVLEAMGAAADKVEKWRTIISDGIIEEGNEGIYRELADEMNNLNVSTETVKERMSELGGQAYDTAVKLASESQSIAELEAALNQLNLSLKDYEAILESVSQKEAEKYDIDADDIEDLADAYLDEADAIVKTKGEARDLAVQNIRMNKGVKELVDNWQDWSKVIKQVDLKSLSKTSLDYIDTIQDLTHAIADLVGASDDLELSDAFFDSAENIKLIEQAATGSESAIDLLGAKVAMDLVDTTIAAYDASAAIDSLVASVSAGDITNDVFAELAAAITNLGSLAEIVKSGFQDLFNTLLTGGAAAAQAAIADGTLMSNEWIKALNDMAYTTNMSVEDMHSMLASAGVQAEVTTTSKTVTQHVPKYVTIETVDTLDDGSDGRMARYRKESFTYQDGTTPVVGDIEVAQINMGAENAGKTPTIRPIQYVGNGSGGVAPSSRTPSKSKGGGGGGGSGSTPEKKTEDRIEDKDLGERYHVITRLIENLDDALDDLDRQIDLTYGTKRLDLFGNKIEELTELTENYQKKLAEAEGYLPIDAAKLQELFPDIKIKINTDTKEIENYDEIFGKILSDYLAFETEYNAFIDKYNAMTPAEQEAAEELLKTLKERKDDEDELFDKRKEALKLYEDTLDVIQLMRDEYEDAMREIEDTKLTQITFKMDLVLEAKEVDDTLRDFRKQINESFSDSLFNLIYGMTDAEGNRIGTAHLDYQQAQAEVELFLHYQELYNDLSKRLSEANDFTNIEDIKDEFLELQKNIVSSGEALLDWVNSILELLPNALDAARERYQLFLDLLEHNDAILENINELYTLQGVTYKTAEGFNRLQRVSQERMDAAIGNAVFNKNQSNYAKAELDKAQLALDDLLAEYDGDYAQAENDVRYNIFKANRDALLEEFNDAQEAMYESAQEAMEIAQEMYLQGVEKTVYDFGQRLSNGLGLDLLQDKYDHYIEQESRYMDRVNEAYNTAAWYNKLQADIDDTTNSTMKRRLEDLQKEIDIRRENNTLSQYDLDILEAKYEVLLAQMALEDALNNKNQLRLVRDRQGNWNYQYTADPNEIADKQQELLDKENEWYNLAKQLVEDVTGEIVSTWQECLELILDVYSDMTLTDQERADRAAEIYDYYTKKIEDLEREKQVAIQDMTEAGNKSLFDMAVVAGDEVADLTGTTADEIRLLVEESGKSMLELLLSDNELIKEIVGSNSQLIDEFDNVFARDLQNMTSNAADFESDLYDTMQKAQSDFDNFRQKVQDVADETGTPLRDMDDKVGAIAESTDKCREAADKLQPYLWNMLTDTNNLALSYAELAKLIMATVRAQEQLIGASGNQVKAAGGLLADLNNGKGYDANFDYTGAIEAGIKNGWLGYGTSQYGLLVGLLSAKRDDNMEEYGWITDLRISEQFGAMKEGQLLSDLAAREYSSREEWLKEMERLGITGFATGGYTGEFADARLAFVHEKELILNEEDTQNILSAVSGVRALGTDFFANIEKALDNNALAGLFLMASKLGLPQIGAQSEQLTQDIHMEVSFPNATDRNEILEALLSLSNDAAQWARRRD